MSLEQRQPIVRQLGNRSGRTDRPHRPRSREQTEIVETHDLTTSDQDGCAVDYVVRRNDDEKVHVEVRCSGSVEATAQAQENHRTLAVMADRGRAEAMRVAESAQSRARRGRVLISIWFDPVAGGDVRHELDYECPLA